MFDIAIFGKDFKWRAPLGVVTGVKATIRHNDVSNLEVTIPASHPRQGLLREPGARLRVKFRDEVLMSGPVRLQSATGPGVSGTLTFSVESDFRVLKNFLGWPAPTRPITQQGDEGAYWKRLGYAESVVKEAARLNITNRSAYPLAIAENRSRGKMIEVSLRMHPLFDRLFPAVDLAGIGVDVQMVDGGLVLDCYTPKVWKTRMKEKSGVIRDWQFSASAPEATRGVVGAQGQGEQREFIPFRSIEREALWGDVIEVFKDARDTSETATHTLRAQQALEETEATGTLTVTLAETKTFRIFGEGGRRPGDVVTAVVGPDIEVTDIIREASLEWNRENGLTIQAVIGPKDEPIQQLMKALAALAKGQRELRVGT